mmetsp:Transcript_44708/g.74029  ORF Transcript_44708/g.74029 Transcript_44708/m.74029 type:complete len:332 (+) Transcript_44708:943-1938(+)
MRCSHVDSKLQKQQLIIIQISHPNLGKHSKSTSNHNMKRTVLNRDITDTHLDVIHVCREQHQLTVHMHRQHIPLLINAHLQRVNNCRHAAIESRARFLVDIQAPARNHRAVVEWLHADQNLEVWMIHVIIITNPVERIIEQIKGEEMRVTASWRARLFCIATITHGFILRSAIIVILNVIIIKRIITPQVRHDITRDMLGHTPALTRSSRNVATLNVTYDAVFTEAKHRRNISCSSTRRIGTQITASIATLLAAWTSNTGICARVCLTTTSVGLPRTFTSSGSDQIVWICVWTLRQTASLVQKIWKYLFIQIFPTFAQSARFLRDSVNLVC